MYPDALIARHDEKVNFIKLAFSSGSYFVRTAGGNPEWILHEFVSPTGRARSRARGKVNSRKKNFVARPAR